MSIIIGTKVKIIDNSGATFSECIEIYKASKYYGAKVGDVILVSLKRVAPNKKLKKGDLVKALVVRTKDFLIRSGNHELRLSDNAVVLLHNTTLLPRAKRCKTPLVEELRFRFSNGLKILSLAPVVL
jgi:large subunit ribosomal protein L14